MLENIKKRKSENIVNRSDRSTQDGLFSYERSYLMLKVLCKIQILIF